jgi:hypothetical protein
MGGASWSGRTVTNARKHWRARLPLPCWRCGRVLTRESRWTVGHIVDRARGGNPTDPRNQWPECARCNFSAGGKLGAQRRNAKHNAAKHEDDGTRPWW